MIKINLLSPSDKSNAKWERINNLIIFNFLILIVGQFIFVFIFLASMKYLDLENNNLDKQLGNMQAQSEIKEVEEIKTNIKKCDKQLQIILGLQENRFNFTETLENFSKIIPEKVKIESINISPKISRVAKKEELNNLNEFNFEIIGEVKDRTSLLEFENNLRNSTIFADLVITLSNYNNKNNNFNYKMTVNL